MNAPSQNGDGYPFPLELVASVASALLARRPGDSSSVAAREQAADEAVRLLEACRDRLERHAQITASERPPPNERDLAKRKREDEIKTVAARFGDPVAFSPGFRYITKQPTEAKAMDWYRHWRRHEASLHGRTTGHRTAKWGNSGSSVEDRLVAEFEFRRSDGFPPRRLVDLREEFVAWKKTHPGQGPGKKKT